MPLTVLLMSTDCDCTSEVEVLMSAWDLDLFIWKRELTEFANIKWKEEKCEELF